MARLLKEGWYHLLAAGWCLAVLLLFPAYDFGQNRRPLAAPTQEQPVVIESEGEAYLGEMDSPREVRERAKRDALNRAVEVARGRFIRSHTLVSNGQVAEDLTYAAVRGKVTRLTVLHEGWDETDRNRFRMRVRAEVAPLYPESGQGLPVKASLSRTTFGEGEEARLFYQAEEDCYIYLFSVASDGSVTLLLPNSLYRDNFVKARTGHVFPPGDSTLRLEARLLPGHSGASAEERIKLIATRQREDLIPLGFREGMFHVYDGRSTGMLEDLIRRLNQLDPADWSETSLTYTIMRRR
ncbi:MAG: DUF4384 domain-containing protein [Syntrophorhabdales bacterium]|jgi:hypothetical protein